MSDQPDIIVQAADIPSIPHVLQNILSLADDPRTSSSELEALVTQEPGLVSQLLKLVNSAYYGLPQKISSISHAMIMLGFSTVKSITSGLMLLNTFQGMQDLDKEYVVHIWRRGLISANLMKYFTRREQTVVKDDLFLAAMIHDIGHIVMRQYFQDQYSPLIAENLFPTVETEQEKFGVDHTQVGASLLKQWNFPEQVIQLVKRHHSPAEFEGTPRIIAYITVCDILAENKNNLTEFFAQESLELEENFSSALTLIDWPWENLQSQARQFVESADSVTQLLQGNA